MKRILFVIIVMVAIVTALFNGTKIKRNILYPMQAKSKAVKYIEEKYDIKPKVTGIDILTREEVIQILLIPVYVYEKPLKSAFIDMEYKGKNFSVRVSWENEFEAYDNYYNDVINEAIGNKIKDMYGEYADLRFADHKTNVYFDGDNLAEVLESDVIKHIGVDVIMVNADMSKFTDADIINNFGKNIDIHLLNCKNEDAFKKICKWQTEKFFYEQEAFNYSLYLDDYAEYDKYNGAKIKHFQTGQCGDLFYTYVNGSYCEVNKSDIPDAVQLSNEENLEKYWIPYMYNIDTDAQEMIVFIPKKELGINDAEELKIIELYTNDGEKDKQIMLYLSETNDNKYISSKIILSDRLDVSFVVGKPQQ